MTGGNGWQHLRPASLFFPGEGKTLMENNTSGVANVGVGDPSGLESLVQRFEDAWQQGPPPALDDFLPPGNVTALVELVHVDLERRLKAGEDRRVEYYRDRYPRLSDDPAILVDLIAAEYELRLRREPHLRPGEYVRRFPHLQESLKQRLAGTSGPPTDPPGGLGNSVGDSTAVSGAPAATRPALPPPSESGPPSRYRPLRFHARGGLGEVLVAEDEEFHREVALKRMQLGLADDPDCRRRFLLEAEVTGRLEHPGIVPAYGLVHDDEGRPCYAMRLIQGETLQEAVGRFHDATRIPCDPGQRSLALRQLLGRFVAVCNAVAYAHSRGIIHRDIKPANVMLGKYGETLLVDWGLAKPFARDDAARASGEETLAPRADSRIEGGTQLGQAVGTPAFMAPEQAAGRWDQLGPTSDIYSLGATLYAVLTGQAPFTGGSIEVLARVKQGSFIPPQQRNKDVPGALAAICLKAMALKPEERYAMALDLAADVEHWLGDEPVSAWKEPRRARMGRWARRHKLLVTGAAVLLATAVFGLAGGLLLLGQKQAEIVQERDAAQKARDQAELITMFYQDHVLAAARPEGWDGGAGKDVTLQRALDQAALYIDKTFAGQPEVEAKVRNALGMTYWYLGKFQDANPHLEKAYAIRLRELGAEHGDTLTSLHNLGMLRWKQGKVAEAIETLRQALERRRRVLGPDHKDTLWTQLYLGCVLPSEKRAEAEGLLRQGIAACLRTLGPDHRITLHGQHDLALVLKEKNQLGEAVALARQTLDGRRRSLGARHPDTLRSMSVLGMMLADQGNLAEAEAFCRQSMEGRRAVLGPDHLETLWGEWGLTDVLVRKGDLAEAEKLTRHCLETSRRSLGREHPDTLDYLALLGEILSRSGRLTDAEPVLRECLRLREKNKDRGCWRSQTVYVRSLLGHCLAQQGKVTEAEPLLLAGYAGVLKAKGPKDVQVVETIDWLIALYEKWDKPAEAEVWRQKRHPTKK